MIKKNTVQMIVFLLVLTVANNVAADNGLVGWWPGDGNTSDIVGGNNGSLKNGAGFAAGQISQAFSVDGINNFVSVEDNSLWTFVGNFTIDLWANFDRVDTGSRESLCNVFIAHDEGGGNTNKWVFYYAENGLFFHINGPAVGSVFLGPFPFTPVIGQFHNFVIKRSGNTYTFYGDGAFIGSETDSTSIPNAAAALTIGQSEGIGFFDGRLDEIMIYNRALSASEIQELYTETSSTQTYYRDYDGDGYGNPNNSTESESQPSGYVTDNTDCDDSYSSIHPGATEIRGDGIDQDCDGSDPDALITYYYDNDDDGYGDSDSPYEASSQPMDYSTNSTDCNDNDSSIHPGATEIRGDGIDQDCDGNDLTNFNTYYRDYDGDGYGNPNNSTESESRPSGYVTDKTDCNDTNSSIHPGATEIRGDGIDQDCDGSDLEEDSIPVAATLVSPDNAASTPVTYTWNAVSNSTWYYLWVNDSSGTAIKTWYTSEEVGCESGAGTCSITSNETLASGNCKWWIRTWNANGYGDWSNGMSFTIDTGSTPNTAPSTATLTSPSGTDTDTTPTYTWNAVSNSTWYYLWVNDSTGTVIKTWYTASEAGCDSGTGTCSVTPSTTLDAGNGSWWIRTWNDYGYGPWSNGMDFTVDSGGGGTPSSGETWTDPTTGMEFVYVEGGCYDMGCGSWTDSCDSDESPVHNVCVDSFWISRYEVTIDEYRQFLLAGGDDSGVDFPDFDCPINDDSTYSLTGNKFSADKDQPMVEVSWYGANAMADWMSGETGYAVRLPTEAEWEYTARSGGKEEKYSGSDNIDTVAWYYYNSGSTTTTHAVGTKAANGLGIYDMSGNVWEWCSDWYDSNYYSVSPTNNPQGEYSGMYRVIRGGGWNGGTRGCRTARRVSYSPDEAYDYVGFRLVLSYGQ